MRTAASRFRLASWDDVPRDSVRVGPALAAGWLRAWLTDPELRSEVIEAYSWIGAGAARAKGWLDERDLNNVVRPSIERALLSGELVLLERTPIAGWKPSLAAPDEAAPEDAPVKAFDAVSDGRTFIDEAPPPLVWEFKVEVESGPGWEPEVAVEEGPAWDAAVRVDVPGDAGGREGGEASAKGGPGSGATPESKEDVFVLAAAIKLLGDIPLVKGLVRIIDPDTDQPVGEEVSTDDKGEFRVEVPEKKDYRVEIVDQPLELDEADPPPPIPEEPLAVLVCRFVDPEGKPLADEPVQFGPVAGDDDDFTTDENGRIEAPAALGPCELTVRGQKFVAHSLPAADAENEAYAYQFVVKPE